MRGVLVTLSLSLCFLLAWVASLIGLAPIVGAFAAGLVLEDVHFKDFVGRGERTLEDLIRPISDVLVPVFFVLMGLRTDLGAFLSPGALELAAALIVVAIIGKQACALGVTIPGANRLAVGIGMIPRGEVGLIFAGVGAGIVARRPTPHRSLDLRGGRADGHRDDAGHAARAQVEPGPRA